MQLTTFSTLASVASAASLLMMTSKAKAAALQPRFSCPEAARFGVFNVTHPATVAYNDDITVSYVQNCPDTQNIRPTSVNLQIGYPSGGAFVQVDQPKPYFAGEKLSYSTKIPDLTLTNFYKGDELIFLGIIEYTQKGPHGGDVTYLYTFEQEFTYQRSNTTN